MLLLLYYYYYYCYCYCYYARDFKIVRNMYRTKRTQTEKSISANGRQEGGYCMYRSVPCWLVVAYLLESEGGAVTTLLTSGETVVVQFCVEPIA